VNRKGGGSPLILAGILSTAAIAFCTCSPVSEYFLTETDTFAPIETSLVNPGGDVFRIFTERPMADTRCLEIAKSHGPLVSLSYGKFSFFMRP